MANNIFGTEQDDEIFGTDDADIIQGLGGNDIIDSKAGDDEVYAGAGDDIIYQSGSGTQHYDGGPGFDKFTNTFPADFNFTLLVDLSTGFSGVKEDPTNILNDTLTGIEAVDFSAALSSVHLIGDSGTNELQTGSGNDYINPGDNSYYDWVQPGAGNDTIDLSDMLNGWIHISYSNLSSAITFNLDGSTNVTTTDKGPNGSDQIIDMIKPLGASGGQLTGTSYDDVFNIHLTSGQYMTVRGYDGVDQYNFSGDGLFRLDLRYSTNAASIDLGSATINDDGFGNQETISGTVERVRGTEFDDYFSTIGLTYRVRLEGEDGDDTLVSGIGRDWLIGGNGNDTLDARIVDLDIENGGDQFRPGLGADVMYGSKELYDAGGGASLSYADAGDISGVIVNVGNNGSGTSGSASGSDINDTFTYVHFFEGSRGDDQFYGSSTEWEGFAPHSGSDYVDGGAGYNVLYYLYEADWFDGVGQGISLNFAQGTVTDTQGYTDTFVNIDEVRGSNFDDFMSAVGYSEDVDLRGYDGDDTIVGGSGADDIEGGAGNDDLTGGSGADRFIWRFALTDDIGNDIVRDFNPSEGDTLLALDENGDGYELSDLNAQITSDSSGNAVIRTDSGNVTYIGKTAAEMAEYFGIEQAAPDPSADTFNVQRGIVGKGSGYDTYIFSKWLIDADTKITITDSGDNALQFINGLEVSSSMVAANAMMLTLSNGAVVTVLDAASYDYTVGGNPLENQSGLSFTYQTFVEDVLGVDMPSGSQISRGDAVTISSDMSFGNDVIVASGTTAFGTDAADEFQLDVSSGGSFRISGFDTSSDSLSLVGLSSATGDVLAEINGDTGIGGQEIIVQDDPFAGETFVNLGIDAEGDVVALTLVGISEADWSSVALV